MYDGMSLHSYTTNTNNIQDYLSRVTPGIHYETGYRQFTGYSRNLWVNVIENYRIDVSGSMPKWYFGTNLRTLTKAELPYVFTNLSNELHYDFSTAKVTNFEFATNFFVKYHVNDYMSLLGDCSRYISLPNGTKQALTIYYNNAMRSLCFYNKWAEMKKKDSKNIPDWCEKNKILRYEVRFYRPDKEFKNKNITVCKLWDDKFFAKVLASWEKQYFKIIKKKQLKIPENINLNSPTALTNFCRACTMHNDSTREAIQWEINNRPIKPYVKSRMNKVVKDAQTNDKLLVESTRMKELDDLVRQVVSCNQ
jgi:hypothetical protein